MSAPLSLHPAVYFLEGGPKVYPLAFREGGRRVFRIERCGCVAVLIDLGSHDGVVPLQVPNEVG